MCVLIASRVILERRTDQAVMYSFLSIGNRYWAFGIRMCGDSHAMHERQITWSRVIVASMTDIGVRGAGNFTLLQNNSLELQHHEYSPALLAHRLPPAPTHLTSRTDPSTQAYHDDALRLHLVLPRRRQRESTICNRHGRDCHDRVSNNLPSPRTRHRSRH